MSSIKPEVLLEIHKLIKTDQAYFIAKDVGWLDGGCWMLAITVSKILPGSFAIAVRNKRTGVIEHIATVYRGWILDGTGVKTERQFRNYWEKDEVDGVGPIDIVPFNLNQSPGPKDLDPYRDRAEELKSFLRSRLSNGRATTRKSTSKTLSRTSKQVSGIQGIRYKGG